MKIKFESELQYQLDAINSICDMFEGQESFQSTFSIEKPKKAGAQFANFESTTGVANNIHISPDKLLDNIQKIQLRNGLMQSTEDYFEKNKMNFTVEMETGTGKTYVYLRTIFELNRRFNFTKFVIVVPSIAIKEGTNKSLQITKEHFKNLYDNTVYEYFTYDSSKLEQVRSFAVNDTIEIMVINIDAFRKSFENDDENNKSNVIHRYNDKIQGFPIEFIRETNPIVIIDEPQSVDNTPKSKEAIASLNPLCCLRYSATHREKYNVMYKLDAINAYEQKLVKQIEVAGVKEDSNHNAAYMFLKSVDNKNGIKAKVTLDIQKRGDKVERADKWLKKGDDLYEITKREQLDLFKKNPQAFIESTIDIIRAEMRTFLVDGIKYHKLDSDVWCQELFVNEELQGYLNSNLLESQRSIYDYVIYDSQVEKRIAEKFETSENVKIYAKLPSWFQIETPLGGYNPDWALVWESDGEQRLYFVVETKGDTLGLSTRSGEDMKIKCGKKHFAELNTGVCFERASGFAGVVDLAL